MTAIVPRGGFHGFRHLELILPAIMAKRSDKTEGPSSNRAAIIVAAIGAFAAVVAAYWQYGPRLWEPAPTTVYGRVIDRQSEQPIRGARVAVTAAGVPFVRTSDTEGVFWFDVPPAATQIGIRITAESYVPWDRSLDRTDVRKLGDVALDRVASSPPPDPALTRTTWQQNWDSINASLTWINNVDDGTWSTNREELERILRGLNLAEAPALAIERDKLLGLVKAAPARSGDPYHNVTIAPDVATHLKDLTQAVRKKAEAAGVPVGDS